MSYRCQSHSKTTSSRTSGGQTHTTSTPETGTSIVVCELSENDLSGLALESTQDYEITEDNSLTKYDFYSFMDSQDEVSETESESDVEYHWFPSLLNTSFIEVLDDKDQEAYMDQDGYEDKIHIDEVSTAEEEQVDDDSVDDDVVDARARKRHHKRHAKKHSKRPRRSEQVPIEVIHIVL